MPDSNFERDIDLLDWGSSFLGAFAKLRIATISFFVPVHSSVGMEQLGSKWTDYHEI
jgi:hypothetical protein